MLDQRLREVKEDLLRPLIVGPLARIHPNRVTQAAFVAGLACAALAATGNFGGAIALWLINRLLDGLDGTMARVTGRQSDWGAYQDIVLDHIVYAMVPLGVAYHSQQSWVFLACAVLQASYFVNTISWCYLSALLEKRLAGMIQTGEITSVTMPSALIEGTETVFFFAFILLFPAYAGTVFLVKATLVTVGVRQRWAFARRHLSVT